MPERKSKDWLEYGCHCFSDIKADLLLPGTGRAIDKIGRVLDSLSFDFKTSTVAYMSVSQDYQSNQS